jgi:hypothetical protein
MFVLLGLILLIIIGLLLNLKNSLTPKKWGIEEILHELEVGRIKNHITDCMSDIGIDAVNYLGTNGGYIYDFQGGTIPYDSSLLGTGYLNYTYLGKTYFVSYGLKKNTHCDQVNYSTAGYPYPELPFSSLQAIYDGSEACRFNNPSADYDGFFGESNMTKLCYVIRETSCKSFAKGLQSGLTIQSQLEDYVAQKLPYCTDFSSFAERMGVIDIVPEAAPIVEADIQAAQVILVVKYPVKIVFQNEDPISKILNYQAVMNIRLGGLYHFAYNVLAADSKNAEWNTKTDYISSYYYLPSFSVTKKKNPCPDCGEPYGQDDLIEFKDSKSLVKGRAMVFRVAVENRRPAIDFIPSTTIDVYTDAFIDIPFNAYDPDDEALRYYFLSLGPGATECSGIGAFDPSPFLKSGEAGSHLLGAAGWCENDLRIIDSLNYSRIWAPIDLADMGRHEVGLLAIDDSGLFDYQFFWINITNPFTDACFDDCIGAGYADEDCSGICSIAANECNSDCNGDFYGSPLFSGPDPVVCQQCIDAIIAAPLRYAHDNCNEITDKEICINHMPDCFWLKWWYEADSSFEESCFNDYDLDTASQPAYILETYP